MWPYIEHSEEDYKKAVEFVQKYAQSLGAKYICSKLQKFTTITGDQNPVQETMEMKIFKFGNGRSGWNIISSQIVHLSFFRLEILLIKYSRMRSHSRITFQRKSLKRK